MPGGGGVLGPAAGLEPGLETPASVGADDPGLPACSLFLQYFGEQHLVADTLVGGGPRFRATAMAANHSRVLDFAENRSSDGLAAPFYARPQPDLARLAGAF